MSETILTTIDVAGQTFVPWSDYAAERAAREAAEADAAQYSYDATVMRLRAERAEAECEQLRKGIELIASGMDYTDACEHAVELRQLLASRDDAA